MSACLFCRVVSGEIPASVVAEDEHCLAFLDIGPQAPTHVLVIPRQHLTSLNDAEDPMLLGRLLLMARRVAGELGVAVSGYRCVINTNGDGGQSVFHLHVHVLAGRAMGWPPG